MTASPTASRGVWCLSVSPRTGAPLPQRSCVVSDGRGWLVATIQDSVVCLAENPGGAGIVWEYSTGGPIVGSAAAASDGSLRVHSSDGHLHGLAADGSPLWTPVEIREPLNWTSPLVDASGNTWICAFAGGLIKIDAAGKKSPRPYLRSPVKFDCQGVLHDGKLIIGGEDQFVHAIDLCGERGAEIWNQDASRGRTNWFINSAVALASGPTFVVASRDGNLYGFSVEGEEVWKAEMPGQLLGSPVVDEADRIFVGLCRTEKGASSPGALACFDIRRRQWIWEVSAPGAVESTPVIGSDGTVYFGDNAGCIQAVSAAGKRLWETWVGAAVRSSGTIVSEGHVVFGDDEGRLFALCCDSPRLSRGWPTALGPSLWNVAEEALTVARPFSPEGVRARIQSPFEYQDVPLATVTAASPPQTTVPAASPPSVAATLPAVVPSMPPLAAVNAPVPALTSSAAARSVNVPTLDNAVEPQPSPVTPLVGRLASVVDFRTGAELPTGRAYPWNLPRTALSEQRPLCLTNPGPGDLVVTVSCTGGGITVSPVGQLRIRPGRRKFVVLRFEPNGDEWLLVDFRTSDARPGRRHCIRIRRSNSAKLPNMSVESIA